MWAGGEPIQTVPTDRRYPISDLWRLGDHPTLAAIDDVLCGELAEQYYFVDEVYRVDIYMTVFIYRYVCVCIYIYIYIYTHTYAGGAVLLRRRGLRGRGRALAAGVRLVSVWSIGGPAVLTDSPVCGYRVRY
jgi:hypothetical protein